MEVRLFGGHKMGGEICSCPLNFMCANMHFTRSLSLLPKSKITCSFGKYDANDSNQPQLF